MILMLIETRNKTNQFYLPVWNDCMEVLLKLVYLSILLIGDLVKINKHPNK